MSGSIPDVSTEMEPFFLFPAQGSLHSPLLNVEPLSSVLQSSFVLGYAYMHNLRWRAFISPRAWDSLKLDL